MNRLARKLVLSVLSVVLTVVALGTTTFAWFTLTNTSIVQPFEAQIVADTGIEVAIGSATQDPLTLVWKNTITATDVYAYMTAEYGEDIFRFGHVTSPDGRNFYDLGGAGVTDGYLEIPLHFRSDSASQINWTAVTLTSTPNSFTTGVSFTDSTATLRTNGSTFTVNAADAFRVSVTGIVDRALLTTGTTAYENAGGGSNTDLGGLTGVDLTGTNGAHDYYYQVNADYPAGITSVTTVATENAITSSLVLDMATGQELIADAANYGVILVRVWFEGWDAEAYNSLLSQIVSVSLRFEA